MNKKYRGLLPSPVLDLVDRIESFANLEIGVEPNPYPLRSTDPNPNHLALSADNIGATILYRNLADIHPHAMLHELLHLERFWLEQVPQVVPVNQQMAEHWNITSEIENSLEHLIIVPREEQYGFEPFGYWTSTTRTNWGRYPWSTLTDKWARRKNCLLGWLSVRYLNKDPNVTAMAESALRKEGLRTEALHFAKVIIQHLSDKKKMLASTVRILGISEDEVAFLTLDIKNQAANTTPFRI